MQGDGDEREDLWLPRQPVRPAVPPPLPSGQLAMRQPAVPPPLPVIPTPWHGWWTLLWCVAILGVWMTFQSGLLLVVLAFDANILSLMRDPVALEEAILALSMNGDFLGAATLATALLTCPLCYFIGKWRPGYTGVTYLALQWPKILPTLFWCGLLIAFAFGFDFFSRAFVSDEEVPEFMVNAITSSEFPILLILGVVVGAPFLEEFVFRGLLFKGWRHSAIGLWGTIVLTSLIWTALHIQYDFFGLAFIFALGILIGYARERTGSLWVPIAMHAANNLLATIVAFEVVG